MNRSSFAFFVALLIHILLLLLFWFLGTLTPEVTPPKQKEKKMKISLKEMPKKYKKSGDTKQKVKPSPIAPPMPKGSQLEKIIKKPPVKYEPTKPAKKPKLNPKPKPKVQKPKPKPQPKVKPLPKKPYISIKDQNKTVEPKKNLPKKPYMALPDLIKSKKTEKKEPLDPLYAMLSQDKSNQEQVEQKTKSNSGSSVSQDVKELYGDEFGKLSPGQQKYILDNQEIMRRITQQILSRVASVNLKTDLNVNRSNVIEFYLHPNGDMSDFKFLEKSGYFILDDTTKETISYAYSRYPRPKEKTLIRYNVFYNLARY